MEKRRDLNRAEVNDSPVGCQSRDRASPTGEVKSRRPHQKQVLRHEAERLFFSKMIRMVEMVWKGCILMNRADQLKTAYALSRHPEGGWFSEVYTAPFKQGDRALAGSIYFLLDGQEISHFHQIDCDEIWYYHEGCGLRITVLDHGKQKVLHLGMDAGCGQAAMVLIPAGAVFAAENLDKNSYTFLSCATTPAFRYAGFRLVGRQEIAADFPEAGEDVLRLAFDVN